MGVPRLSFSVCAVHEEKRFLLLWSFRKLYTRFARVATHGLSLAAAMGNMRYGHPVPADAIASLALHYRHGERRRVRALLLYPDPVVRSARRQGHLRTHS